MNKVILCGRLTRDPETRYTTGENAMAISRYTIAIDRLGNKTDDQSSADFINCVSFNKQGEFAEKYLKQGMKILIEGRIQTGSYTNKDGVKVYTTDVVVERHEFVESKNSASSPAAGRPEPSAAGDGFMNIPDGVEDEGLPF